MEATEEAMKNTEKHNDNKDITIEEKEDLRVRVEELKIQNGVLLAENDMYEQFMGRLGPQDLAAAEDPKARSGGRKWRQRSQPEQQLTLQQKHYVVLSEIKETQQEQEKIQQKNERTHDNFKNSIKEAEFRQKDIRKSKGEFERSLLKPLRQNRLDIYEPEKVLRYIKDKSKISQIERCNLRTQSLLATERRLLQLLQQRKDLGKADYEDFFQDLKEAHGEINLHQVYVNNVKAQHALNSHKEKLHRATFELSNICRDLREKHQKLERLEEAIHHNEEERFKAQILNRHLKQQLADYQAPDTTQYMLMKEKHRKLQQSVLTLERKVGVAETALKAFGRSWTKHRATLTPANSAEIGARGGGHQVSVKLPAIAEH